MQSRQSFRLRQPSIIAAVLLLPILLGGLATAAPPQPQDPGRTSVISQNMSSIYLPSISVGAEPGGGGGDGGGGGGGGGSGDSTASATFWLPREDLNGAGIATNNPQVAVDRNGGIHVAYRISARTTDGSWPAFYMYCASGCANPAAWTRVALGADVVDVRLQVDAAGRPRLLLLAYVTSSLKQLQYAACDTGCSNLANWTLTRVTTTHYADPYQDEHANHSFALDAQGRPGFVYVDATNPQEHNGTFYAYCQRSDPRACTSAAAWQEKRLSPQNLGPTDLVYTANGQARILGSFSPDGHSVKLVYIECDATCGDLDFVQLWDTDGYADWSLRLDRTGRPRFALYSGWYVDDIPSQQIFYVWCDANCLTATSWQRQALSPRSAAQQQLDMQLDAQNRPRLVFGTSYAWCNGACESANGDWQAKVIETSSTLNELYPVPVPTDCTESTWAVGYIPTLALDPQGNPRVTFVAKHFTSGIRHSDGRNCDGTVDIIWARFSMFPQP